MVIDTSALLHIVFAEPGWEDSLAFLLTKQPRLLASPAVVEAQAVIAVRAKGEPKEILDDLLDGLIVQVVPFSESQAELARDAYLKYGKGSGHKAQLNCGDVMTYALAKDLDGRLAFVGDDFHFTDLATVRLPIPK